MARMFNANTYSDAAITICPVTAQADLSKINKENLAEMKVGEAVEFLHSFDSRWRPNCISDTDLDNYLDESCSIFIEILK